MKKLFTLLWVMILIFSLCACDNSQLPHDDNQQSQGNDSQQSQNGNEDQIKNNDLPKPDTNLEFWIGENVDNVDFSKYQEKYGMFGGHEYYGTSYIPTFDEYKQPIDPEHCVLYTVTSYPDYSNKEQHITGIYITDPDIVFYGISLSSSFEDFELSMTEQGFAITGSNENHRTAEKDKLSITITKEWIRIRVDVENKEGIIF